MCFPDAGAACKDRPRGDDPDRVVDGKAFSFALAVEAALPKR
jgi:hypothetical protein